MNLHAITRFAADGVFNSLLAGGVIALLAGGVTRLVRRHGSGTRFAVWFWALVAIVILPWVGSIVAACRASAPTLAHSALTLPASFAVYLLTAWVIGASFGLLRVGHGLYRLRRLRATCTPVNPDQLDPRLFAVVAREGRGVTLCISDAVRVPAAIGYFRPMVLLPAWTLVEIQPDELKAILLHELAHLRRWDDWTNLAQKIVKAVFFFHPAVWFIESQLTLEREMACDDVVLATSFSPRAYAQSLVGLAEKSFLRRGVQLAQAAVGHVQQLRLRLAEILRSDRSRQASAPVWKPAIALISLAGMLSAYGFSWAPRLISFSNDAPVIALAPSASPTGLDQTAIQLRPVNLSYADRIQRANSPVGKVERAHLRVPRHALLTPPLKPAAAPVIVVFQGEQFGANGQVLWRVTIVHLTPFQQRILSRGLAKQI